MEVVIIVAAKFTRFKISIRMMLLFKLHSSSILSIWIFFISVIINPFSNEAGSNYIPANIWVEAKIVGNRGDPDGDYFTVKTESVSEFLPQDVKLGHRELRTPPGPRPSYEVGDLIWWNISVNIPSDYNVDPEQTFEIPRITAREDHRYYLRVTEPEENYSSDES